MSDETIEQYENLTLRDFDNEGIELVNLSYLARMFDLVVVNERGKPVQITLTEKPESFSARNS